MAPSSTDGADAVRRLAAAAEPEEDIFGLVYDDQERITGGGEVTLEEVGSGACIHVFTAGTPTCLGSQTMMVNPTGIRPGQTEIMWGWYNDLDTDLNPCRAAEENHDERHDEDFDGQPDGGVEKHCVTLGTYRVTLEGGLTRTRTIDHLSVSGEVVAGKQVEDPTVASPGAGNFFDTIVHFDVGTATYPLQNLNAIGIDNPETGEAFASGDTVVPVGVPVRIDSGVTTPAWDLPDTKGRLLARTFFDFAQSVRSNHWDPAWVIRTHPYTSADTFQVRVEATTPEKPTDAGTTSSVARTVIVQPATGDQAAPAGHTFPASMSAGGLASVTLAMTNSGTTTWSGAGYRLTLYDDPVLWTPSFRFLPSSVSPGSEAAFAFDLRHAEPEVTGTLPAFYRMAKSGTFFGAENGREIFVSGPKLLSTLGEGPAVGTASLSPETTRSWTSGAEDGGTSALPLGRAALEAGGGVVLEYTYHHAVPRDLDVVLQFTYDPDLVEPLPPRRGPGASRLTVRAGPGEEGEYWVRLTGTVPAGEGRIADLPFRRVESARVPADADPGTLTVHYPR